MITHPDIDGGKGFDWGKASADYAKYRDIYPQELYDRLTGLGLGVSGQTVLDLGTGTGVLPRNLYRHGARWVGVDIAAQQIEQADRLAAEGNMDIDFRCCPCETLDFPPATFDVVTACQCFFYFDHTALAPRLRRMLRAGGRLAVVFMAWLPYEDHIAMASEELVLRFNPAFNGGGETRRPVDIPGIYSDHFSPVHSEVFDVRLPFTRESWNGRMKACRGIGASLDPSDVRRFEAEHLDLLAKIAPEHFSVLHYVALSVLAAKPPAAL